MKRLNFLVLLVAISYSLKAQKLSPQTILEKSIAFHDPDKKWGMEPLQLNLRETRPKGADRQTKVQIDLMAEKFILDQNRDKNQIIRVINGAECSYKLNGKEKFTEEEVKTHRLDCDRTKFMRDYYTYLWGLPMKLKDPGTVFDNTVDLVSYQDKSCYELKVVYDPEVGDDIWYFYFDQKDFSLIGYKFFHDESKNDGEYITLEGMETVNGIKLPKTRKWYTNKENRFLGADVLDSR